MAVYALSDLHGRLDLWEKANQELFKPDDTIYFLGDAADRGPDGWQLIKTLLADRRVKYLKGNHEDLLIQASPLIDFGRKTVDNFSEVQLWRMNGGQPTVEEMLLDKNFEYYYIRMLDNLPLHARYINKRNEIIDLSHAGFSYNTRDIDLLWDRDHIYDYWIEDERFDDFYIVHGHTPTPNLAFRIGEEQKTEEPHIHTYCNGHKKCIDMGAFATNTLAILDLDTWEEYYITI